MARVKIVGRFQLCNLKKKRFGIVYCVVSLNGEVGRKEINLINLNNQITLQQFIQVGKKKI